MRVAYVCSDPGVPVFGSKGASVHVLEVVRALRRRGDAVDLFCVRTGGPVPADLADLPLHVVGLAPANGLASRERAAKQADAELGDLLGGAGSFGLVYERYGLWGRSATAHARRAGTSAVLEVNAPLIDEQARYRGLADRPGAEAVLRAVLGDATLIAAVSTPVAAWLRRNGAAPDKVVVVPNGVDTLRVHPAAAERPRPFTVGFVGSLKPWHGLDVLVDAFATLATSDTDSRLLLVGDGPDAKVLRRRVAVLGLAPRVEFSGAVPPAEVPAWLHRMHVAVAPYPDVTDSYFSPLKLFEYLAAGLPVVASRTGQAAHVISEGEDGVLVPPGDPAALAQALVGLRDDADRRSRLGAAARQTALARHRWSSVVNRILGLVEPTADEAA